MSSLNNDIEYISAILNGQNEDTFGFIYSRTNENLVRLFEEIDVLNKDVYTVLSSADFFLSAVNAGAKKIDSFDINPLTNRYYHLRKWLLQYGLIDADGQSLSTLLYIVKNHFYSDSLEEQDSVTFWLNFLNKIDNIHFYSNVLFEYIERPEVPYSKNIEKMVEKLTLIEPRFDVLDICSKLNNIEKHKYDIIYLSNILDYNRDNQKINNSCTNILNLLKSKGEVICSHMLQDNDLDKEHSIYLDYFNYDEFFVDEIENGKRILYYKYTKK